MVVARRCFLSPSLRSAKRVLRFALGKLPKILEKHLWHGSSICWSYRRRCNVVGDLMRHLLCWPAFLLLFNTKFSVESIGVLLFWRALQRRVVHSSVELCTPQLLRPCFSGQFPPPLAYWPKKIRKIVAIINYCHTALHVGIVVTSHLFMIATIFGILYRKRGRAKPAG